MKLRIVIDADMKGSQSMDTVVGLQESLIAITRHVCGPLDKFAVVVTSGEEGGDQEHCIICGGCVMKEHSHPGMCCCPLTSTTTCSHLRWEWKPGMQRVCAMAGCKAKLPPELEMVKKHIPYAMSCGDDNCLQCQVED